MNPEVMSMFPTADALLCRALFGALLLLPAMALAAPSSPKPGDKPDAKRDRPERTSFQTGQGWNEAWDIRTDAVMAYGIDPGLPARLKSYIDRGYVPHVMTGVSWGQYQDYLYGRFDGKNHEDAAQQRKDGTKVSHGGDVYYMVPEENFGKFLNVGVKRAIDAGAEAIFMEEPEFWSFSGWSPAFQREWKSYFKEDWQAPDSSVEAHYRSGELKYYLYKRALGQVFTFVNEYGKQIGRDVKCYVPTHSMLNYACWGIVSPESSLATIEGCDGYIAQVWTGTARTPNFYNGVKRERTFETAFLEYGQSHNMTRATGRRMVFLTDPIEDNPRHSWADYKTNYEQTLAAALLWPEITHFEVVPWPERVFRGEYPKVDEKQRKEGEPVEKEKIPAEYATELMVLFEVQKDMAQKDVEWHAAHGVGVLVSDTLMFHRGGPNDPSEDLSQIYGQMLPLLKRGVAVEPVQLENAPLNGFLKPYKVLYLSYVGQKPMDEKPHAALAKWVKDGGVLVLLGQPDPFAKIRAWWNTGENHFDAPDDHLRKALGLPAGVPAEDTVTKVGRGTVIQTSVDPRAVAEQGQATLDRYMSLTGKAFQAAGLKTDRSNAIWLRRGPYVVGAVMEESVSNEPLRLKGHFVDLFDGRLPVLTDPTFGPGRRFLLMDLSRVANGPSVVANASGIEDWTVKGGRATFQARGPKDVHAAIRLRLPAPPTGVKAADAAGQNIAISHEWDAESRTALVRVVNDPEGVQVTVGWQGAGK
jgi:hypothetical protein